jgi:hypothetical protein
MKKFVVVAFAAVCVLAGSQQKAAAWSKFSFSTGLAFSWETGGSSKCWYSQKTSENAPGCFGGYGCPGGQCFSGGYDYCAPAPGKKPEKIPAPKPSPKGDAVYYNPANYGYGYDYSYAGYYYGN